MSDNLKKAYVRPFHFYEESYSFKQLITEFCLVPKNYPIRNKSAHKMRYFCEKCYFYKQYTSAFDNETYKNKFEVRNSETYLNC